MTDNDVDGYRLRLLDAMESIHGKRGVAMLQDAMDLEEESHEVPPLGYRKGFGVEEIKTEGELL